MAEIQIEEAQLDHEHHQQLVLELVNAYASDSLGNGKLLAPEVQQNLIAGLQKHPTTIIFLGMLDGKAHGIAVCFLGFSTFAAKPLINIHDLYVRPEARGQGLAKRLLEAIVAKAQLLGCCKLTLEVLENNRIARKIYDSFGFAQATYVKEAGGAIFMAMPILPR